MRRRVIVAVWMALVAAGASLPARLAAETYARPGDNGTIMFPVQNSSDSNENLTNVSISVSRPGSLNVPSVANIVALVPGQSTTFPVDYSVNGGAAEGVATIILSPTWTNDPSIVRPEANSISFRADINIDKTAPQITVFDPSGTVAASDGSQASHNTEGNAVRILMEDKSAAGGFGSGPGRVEVWRDALDTGSLLAVDNGTGTQDRTFIFPGRIPGGFILVRAFDQVGNSRVVSFICSGGRPKITIGDGARFNYDHYSGIAQEPFPSTLSPAYGFHLTTPLGTTFDLITLTKDGTDVSSSLPSSVINSTSPALDDSLSINLNSENPYGLYSLTAHNSDGLETSVSWRLVTIRIGIADSPSSTYDGGGQFTAHIEPTAFATLGIESISPNVLEVPVNYSQASGLTRLIVAKDKDGNSAQLSVDVRNSVFPIALESTSGGVHDSGVTKTGFIDGGVIFSGPHPDPISGEAVISTNVGANFQYTGLTGPVNGQTMGTVSADVLSGQSAASATNPCHLVTATFIYGQDPEYDFGNRCVVGPYVKIHLEATPDPQFSFINVIAGPSVFGQVVSGIDPPLNEYFPGQSSATLPSGIQLTHLDLSTPTLLTAIWINQPPVPGYLDIQPNQAVSILALSSSGEFTGELLASTMTVTVSYSSANLTSAQESSIKITLPGLLAPFSPDSVDLASHTVTFRAARFGTFKLIRPSFVNPINSASNNVSITADQNVQLGDPTADARYPQFLSVLASQGIVPVGGHIRSISPFGTAFTPPALVTAGYAFSDLAALGVNSGALFLGHYSLASAASINLFSVQTDTAGRGFVALINTISTAPIIGVFANTSAHPAAADLLPPLTSLVIGGTPIAVSTGGGSVFAASTAVFSFSSIDPTYPGAPVSGTGEIHYLIDQPFVSTTATPGQPFTAPFGLNAGTHFITFFCTDRAGNVESAKVANVTVTPGFARVTGGYGMGVDGESRLWSAVLDGGGVSLTHNDANGVVIGSATLPGADPGLPWSVLFDSSGTAYSIGSVQGPSGDLLAVLKASPSGDAIVSSRTFDSGFGSDNFVFDSASAGWIVGAVQTQNPESPSYSMAVWHFDPETGLVQLTTTYARAGFDAATGVTVDSSGHLWISGFSRSPNPRSPRGIDLALWEYDSDGRTLLRGPLIREGALSDYNTSLLARVAVSSGVVYVTSPRGRATAGTDLALTSFDASTGQMLTESAWRSPDGAAVYPLALFVDVFGRAFAAGSYDYGDGTLAGIWRYRPNGDLLTATQVDAGGAEGAVFNGSSLWLSVDGSTSPVFVALETNVFGSFSDVVAPRTSVTAGSPSFNGSTVYVSSNTPLGFSTVDDKLAAGDALGSGISVTYYGTDGASFSAFTSSFTLISEGTHTVSFYSLDLDGNAEAFKLTPVGVDLTPPTVALVSTGPAYAVTAQDPVIHGAASGVSQINYLIDVSPDACHDVTGSTAAPRGTCANLAYAGAFTLAPGTHTVYFQAVDNVGNGQDVIASSYVVVASTVPPVSYALAPSSGPIGVPFAITGSGFGAYAGTNTRVKFGLVAAPVSVWNDTTISGSIPGLSTGSYAVTVERQNASSVTVAAIGTFELTPLSPTSLAPLTGPIGTPFTISGPGFGPYSGTLTRVLFDGTTAPLSVWNDATISGYVPNVLPGTHAIWIERSTSGGGLESSDTAYFEVTAPSVAAISPSSGPIGVAFTLTGQSFGGYAGTLTQVLFGDTTAAISLWNDTTITGTIPGALTPAVYPVRVARRSTDGGLSLSNTAYFQVTGLALTALSPSSGPIGTPFTLMGAGFGAYAGVNTRLLLGGATAAVSVWNDTTISGSVPGVSGGTQSLWIERLNAGGVESSNTVYFQVAIPSVTGVNPSSGPIGIAFSLAGSGFGSYAGTNTQVLIAGTTAPISTWSDSTITGTIPGSIPTGIQTVVVSRRASDGGVVLSGPAHFQVTGMSLDSLSPSTGPIGIPFTIHGSQFGTYNGTNTRVRFGAVTAAISVWNDATITGTIPALPIGVYTVAVERQQGANVALSNYSTFTLTDYNFTGLTPSSGPIGVAFTVTGSGFGPYAGTNTRVLIGGTTAAVSVWNDAQISGTVPPLPAGSQPMWIERLTSGGVQSSDTAYFLVTVPDVSSLVPSSAPIGAPFTLRGTSFGPYAGTNTRVKFNGVAAPISVWNDTLISGTVPGALSTGAAVIVVERASGSGLVQSDPGAFLVLAPTVSSITPASGTAGTVVTLSGFGFGPYAGTATKLLVNGSTVAVAVWNDSTIRWTVPSGLGNGTYPVTVVRSPSGGTIQSAPVDFTVGTGVSALFAAAPLASQPDVRFVGDLNLPASEGGRIQTPAQAAVEVPPGALDQDTEITLAREKEAFKADRKAALSRNDLGTVGEAIQFGPEGTRFSQPVLIELPYDPALVPPGKLGEVAINYYDPAAKTWTPLLTQADSRRHVLSARTDHFSLYQPLGRGIRVAAGGELRFADVYVFPNPARGARSVTIRAQPGGADSVSVRVYDLTGRKVYESSNFSISGGTYDNVWDLGGVGSGVYSFVVTAKKSGQADIHAQGRIGVIK